MHAPPEVQHWAEIDLPSGATIDPEEAMQTPPDTTSEFPLRASTPKEGEGLEWGGGGVPAVGADVGAGV